jgi:hypothetical protein
MQGTAAVTNLSCLVFKTTVVDGRNGRPLLNGAIKSSIGAQSSPLTISVQGLGNDIFLYWNADCKEHEGEGGEFSFVNGTNNCQL